MGAYQAQLTIELISQAVVIHTAGTPAARFFINRTENTNAKALHFKIFSDRYDGFMAASTSTSGNAIASREKQSAECKTALKGSLGEQHLQNTNRETIFGILMIAHSLKFGWKRAALSVKSPSSIGSC